MSYADRHPSRKWGGVGGRKERGRESGRKEGEGKEKSDGRVKAGGVQRRIEGRRTEKGGEREGERGNHITRQEAE